MNLKALALCAVLIAGSAMVVTQVYSQDAGGKDTPADVTRDAMTPDMMMEAMKKWQAVANPGEHHAYLKKFAGQWEVESKMWMDPASPPSVSHGFSNSKLVLDGRFVLDEFRGEIALPDPATGKPQKQKFEGLGLTGFDNYKNQYVACWADNMNTALTSLKGTLHPETKVLTLYGEADEPGLDVHERMLKSTIRFVSDDEYVMEMFDLHAGDNYKVMELTYKRKK